MRRGATGQAGPASRHGVSVAQGLRILLIDDEEMILAVFSRVLRPLGEIVTVGSGEEALELLRRDAAFDAVVCDLLMPGMDGPALFEHVRASIPHLLPRFVFCSGGAFTPEATRFVGSVDNPVVDKPCSPGELRDAVASRASILVAS